MGELRQNDRFNELLEFIASNWSQGTLGPESRIKDEDRVELLFAMTQAGVVSKRILGETTNMVVDK